jgi:hypothetical protein
MLLSATLFTVLPWRAYIEHKVGSKPRAIGKLAGVLGGAVNADVPQQV